MRATALLAEVTAAYEKRYTGPCDRQLLPHLGRLLFKKRKLQDDVAGAPQPGGDDETDEGGNVLASENETWRAIVSVLQVREQFLATIGVNDPTHLLSDPERIQMVAAVRKAYEALPDQVSLQRRDHAYALAHGYTPPQDEEDAAGAAQPSGRAKGKGSVRHYVRMQKRKRWCRHLQRVAGTKQIWEVIAFSGRFDEETLTGAMRWSCKDNEPEKAAADPRKTRVQLHAAKAEAKAAFREGRRLARHRADQPGKEMLLTSAQKEVLEKFDSGELRNQLIKAISDLGHGTFVYETGDLLEIGGSTGGGSRRIIDGWVLPDWRDFIQDPDEPANW